jgi:GT2 family glycosyltransferase
MPTILVCVPVWRAKDFVAETLESVLRQREVRLKVLISIDGADAESEAACRPFLADPRVRMVVRTTRLGWAGNARRVFAEAVLDGAEYTCLQPSDDLLAEEYLAALLAEAERDPQVAVTYCDIQSFGSLDHRMTQESVTGSPLDREVLLLRRHFAAVAWRGLTRVSALRRLPALRGNRFDDFAEDTVWMALLARAGNLVRVPHSLYRKRYHEANTHLAWFSWPQERKLAAWVQHCCDMLEHALAVAPDAHARDSVVQAARDRLLANGRPLGPYHAEINSLSDQEREQLIDQFQAGCMHRGFNLP